MVSIFKTSLNVVVVTRICHEYALHAFRWQAAKIPRENFSLIPYLFLVPEEIEFGELFFEEQLASVLQ